MKRCMSFMTNMAPKVRNNEAERSSESFHEAKEKLEIFYNGYYYDVTDFVSRHPGGNVIKFYTDKREDATQAFDQFHFRSRGKVDLIMKSLKRRKAEPDERGLDPKTKAKHEALTADFNKLFEELKAEGYFEPCLKHVTLRLLECLVWTLFGYGFFFEFEHTWNMIIFGTIFAGFGLSRFGWLLHEGGHTSLTGNVRIDKWIQDFCVCYMVGGSSKWWNSQHNRHHAMPQRLHHDVDLATLPYVAFHKRTVRDKKEINRFFIRYQSIFYWTLDMFVITIAWKFVVVPRYQLHKRSYREMLLNIPSWYLMYYGKSIIGYFLLSYWFAFFLGINFALSHSHLEVADKPTHWIEYALTHTANIKSNMLVDYWMGYLNYQIEHHLFPTMPQFRQKEISHRVKVLAEKHGLPYQVYNYFDAVKLAMKNLNTVGKELTSDQFSP